MASGEAVAPGPAAMQTVVLRVSIHCLGCKKKVRKVLRSIEGVKNVTVDAAQHRVTVTGTVDAHTLIKRLYKSGKQAVLWHGHPPVTKNPEAEPAPEATPPAGDGGKDDAAEEKKPEEQAVKEPQAETESSDKKPEQDVATENKPEAEDGTESEKKEEEKPSDEAKKDGGESEATEPEAKGAEPSKETVAAAAKSKNAGEAEPAAATMERSLFLSPAPAARHPHEEHYPYYAPQPMLSYHTAQPSASMSYYAPRPEPAYTVQQPPPPPQQQPHPMQQWSPSYLYTPYPHTVPELSYYHDYYSSPPGMHSTPPPLQDSYRLFDDENPNACSVM